MMRIALSIVVVGMMLTGCVVRTTRPAHRAGDEHHRHEHCHDRGGKHHKKVCHNHPHEHGHH